MVMNIVPDWIELGIGLTRVSKGDNLLSVTNRATHATKEHQILDFRTKWTINECKNDRLSGHMSVLENIEIARYQNIE